LLVKVHLHRDVHRSSNIHSRPIIHGHSDRPAGSNGNRNDRRGNDDRRVCIDAVVLLTVVECLFQLRILFNFLVKDFVELLTSLLSSILQAAFCLVRIARGDCRLEPSKKVWVFFRDSRDDLISGPLDVSIAADVINEFVLFGVVNE
jgi:hypothetical protein